MTALLLVDIQRDFLPGGALAVPQGDLIIPVVNGLIDKNFDHIIASKDWHPEGHVSFADTHDKKVGKTVTVKGILQLLWPTHCVQDSLGAAFPQKLKTQDIEKIVYKGTDPEVDSYSAFFDNAKLRETGLNSYLKEKGIHTLFVTGLATDYCIKATVLDALSLGYKTYLITDGCRAVNLNYEDEKKALGKMQEAGALLTTSIEVTRDLEKEGRE